MLNIQRIYMDNRDVYEKCERPELVVYLYYLKDAIEKYKMEGLQDARVDKWLEETLAAIDGSKAFARFYDYPADFVQDDNRYYCLIKDNEVSIVQKWSLYDFEENSEKHTINQYRNKGYIVCRLRDFLEKNVVSPHLICSNGMTFITPLAAAEWCVETGRSKGSVSRALTQLEQACTKGKTAYKLTWQIITEKIDCDNMIFRKGVFNVQG